MDSGEREANFHTNMRCISVISEVVSEMIIIVIKILQYFIKCQEFLSLAKNNQASKNSWRYYFVSQ